MDTGYENDIVRCLEVLAGGGVILYPTDTVWGLGCDATNETAVDRIFSIKQRPGNKALIVLLGDLRDINRYVAAPPPEAVAYIENTSRPTTVLYNHILGLAANVAAEDGSVAMRVVKDDFCRHLVKRFRKPVVSTSANISGHPTPAVFTEIDSIICESVDYVVSYRRDDLTRRPASQLVRFGVDGTVEVLRS